jgi:predicted DNA binding CopG/RHH family protein
MSSKSLKRFPEFATDEEAEEFVANADLAEFDLSDLRPMRFELAPKSAQLNMRLPDQLLQAVKDRAKERGIPYTRLIREALERTVASR